MVAWRQIELDHATGDLSLAQLSTGDTQTPHHIAMALFVRHHRTRSLRPTSYGCSGLLLTVPNVSL
jgi:hypothetical protein